MTNVIGYKGDESERYSYWRSMIDMREYIRTNDNVSEVQHIVDMDKAVCKEFIKVYIEEEDVV